MMKRVLLLGLLLSVPSWSAPLVDINHSTQARDATATLQARGLLQGYPDNTTKGDRAMSRYEVSKILDRLDQLLQSQETGLAPKSDVKTVKESVQTLMRSLDELGGRVSQDERETEVLDNTTK